MNIPANITMIDGATSAAISNVFVNNNCAAVTLQVTGSFTTATVQVEGLVNLNSNSWVSLGAIELSEFEPDSDGLSEKSLYQVGIEGIPRVRIHVTAVSGGDITVVCQFGAAVIDPSADVTPANLTPITAYDMAIAGGYTGTKAQFETDMGNSATNAANAANSAASVAASAAQITQNANDISNLKTQLNELSDKSIFTSSDLELMPKRIDASGVMYDSANYVINANLLKRSDISNFSVTNVTGITNYIYGYNDNGEYVAQSQITSASVLNSFTSDATYLRFGVYKSGGASKENYDSVFGYKLNTNLNKRITALENNTTALENNTTALRTEINIFESVLKMEQTQNLLDTNKLSDGYLNSNGTIHANPSDGDWKTSDYIPVDNITSIIGSRGTSTGGRATLGFGFICTYGNDKNSVLNYYQDNRNVYTTDNGVKYVRISFHGSFSTPMISIGTTLPETYIPYITFSGLTTTPESFGAIGDGIADDTAAFQYALNSGAKNINASGVYNVTTLYIDNETNVVFNQIKGNIVIKGYRNIVIGKKLEGSAPLVIGFETDTASSNIIQIDYIYNTGYTTGDCILLDGETASVMNNLFINCQTNRGEYGFHMRANSGFCNQNVILMCVSTNAAGFGMFLENLNIGTGAGAKMNGGRYYNFDPESSAGAVKMVGKCEAHCFYGLRLREFGNREPCFTFDENVDNIYFDNGFKYGQISYLSENTNIINKTIKCAGLFSDSGNVIFKGFCEITGSRQSVTIYPITKQPLKLINISENTDFSYYTSDKNVSYNVFRNSESAETGTQVTAVLRPCYSYGRIDKVYSFANTGEIAPRINAGTKYFTPPASQVEEPTLYEFDMVSDSLTLMKAHRVSIIQQ